MPLTDTAIRKAKPVATVQKLRDGGGLYLLLRPDGAKWWRWATISIHAAIGCCAHLDDDQLLEVN
ncbi:Arm DNA-binding domain-containing protein, partial [Xanthomonas citri]